MKTSIFAMIATALLVSATGCSSPCDDLKDCCEATEGATGCDLFDEADDDACEALIDAYQAPEGADVPEECKF